MAPFLTFPHEKTTFQGSKVFTEAIFPYIWGYICIVVLVPDLRVKKRPLSLFTVAFSSLSDRVLLVAQKEKIHKLSENCSGVSATSFVVMRQQSLLRTQI